MKNIIKTTDASKLIPLIPSYCRIVLETDFKRVQFQNASGGTPLVYLYYTDTTVDTSSEIALTSSLIKDKATLQRVVLREGVTSIEYGALAQCDALVSVTLPSTLTTIGATAFADDANTNFTSIALPDSIKTIGANAFTNCTKLGVVTYKGKSYTFREDLENALSLNGVSVGSNAFYNTALLEYEILITLHYGTSTITSTSSTVTQSIVQNVTALTSAELAEGVTSIEYAAFAQASSLSSITMPSTLVTIANNAFLYDSSLTTIEIPTSVTSIGNYAFEHATALSSVTYNGKSYTYRDELVIALTNDGISVGTDAFLDTALSVHPTLITINYTDGLPQVTSSASTLTSSIATNVNKITSVDLASGVTAIADGALAQASSLTSITMPLTLTTIGENALAYDGNSSFTSVTLPANITNIGDYAFYNCEHLGYVVYKGSTYDYRDVLESVLTSNSVTFGNNTFEGTALKVHDKLITIVRTSGTTDTYTATTLTSTIVGDASTVQSVALANGVTLIDENACGGGFNLSSVTIANSVTSIGNYAFEACTTLSSITIPTSVTSIGDGVFYDCSGLTSVTYNGETYEYIEDLENELTNGSVTLGSEVFRNTGLKNRPILVTITYAGTSETTVTKTASTLSYSDIGNRTAVKSVSLASGFTSICANTFAQISTLESVTTPITLETIGENAFRYDGNSAFTTIDLHSSIKSIGDYAFNGCTNLSSVTYNGTTYEYRDDLENELTNGGVTFGTNTFTATSLKNHETQITILRTNGTTDTSTATTLTSTIVGTKTTAKSISLASGVTLIEEEACRDCSNLTSVTMTDSVTDIEPGAFYDCVELTSVKLSDSITAIYASTFENCQKLARITLPSAVTRIDNQAFEGCTSLSAITIPNTIATIDFEAFSGCSSLTSVTYSGKTYEYRQELEDALTANSVTLGTDVFTNTSLKERVYTVVFTYDDGFVESGINVTMITEDDIYTKSSLVSVNITTSVTGISDGAFEGCNNTGFTTVEIPTSVTYIGDEAFSGCSYLSSVTYDSKRYVYKDELLEVLEDNGVDVGDDVFTSTQLRVRLAKIRLTYTSDSDNIVETFTADTLVSSMITSTTKLISVELVKGAVAIGNSALANCMALTSVTLAEGVTTIGDSAFAYGSDSLTSLTLPTSITSIGSHAFSNTKIASITYDETTYSNPFSLALALRNNSATVDSTAFASARMTAYEIEIFSDATCTVRPLINNEYGELYVQVNKAFTTEQAWGNTSDTFTSFRILKDTEFYPSLYVEFEGDTSTSSSLAKGVYNVTYMDGSETQLIDSTPTTSFGDQISYSDVSV